MCGYVEARRKYRLLERRLHYVRTFPEGWESLRLTAGINVSLKPRPEVLESFLGSAFLSFFTSYVFRPIWCSVE